MCKYFYAQILCCFLLLFRCFLSNKKAMQKHVQPITLCFSGTRINRERRRHAEEVTIIKCSFIVGKRKRLPDCCKDKFEPIDSAKHLCCDSLSKFWCIFKKDTRKEAQSKFNTVCSPLEYYNFSLSPFKDADLDLRSSGYCAQSIMQK